jgi:hypothetical protein
MSRRLDHDKLEIQVYQTALAFITWLESILVALININSKCCSHDRSLGSESDSPITITITMAGDPAIN